MRDPPAPSTNCHRLQKPQLKVGKARPKASNFTDTSFKAKSIVLNKQSISANAPTLESQFSHHVSLLRSRSDSQRSDSLAYLASVISAKPDDTPFPEAIPALLPKLQPLLLDGSPIVRQQLLKLLRCLPAADVMSNIEQLLLYIQAGLNHLSEGIRTSSVEVLAWLLNCAGAEYVGSIGGWTKTLDSFMSLLGWQEQSVKTSQGWSSYQGNTIKPGGESKAIGKRLAVFSQFLQTGLSPSSKSSDEIRSPVSKFPMWHVRGQLLPERPSVYAKLDLFGSARNDDHEALDDREDRQRVFAERYESTVARKLEHVRKEGGELGRAAVPLAKVLAQGMSDFDRSIISQ